MIKVAFQKSIIYLMLFTTIFLYGCVSEERFILSREYAIGSSYQVIRTINASNRSYHYRIGWKEKYTILENENKEYENPVLNGTCTVFWEVDEDDIIVGYRYQGSYCKI